MSEQITTEEHRWVPISESGNRWAARSLEEAEQAMRDWPAGGAFLDGSPYDGVVRIAHEVRRTTDWHEPAPDQPATAPRPTEAEGGEAL